MILCVSYLESCARDLIDSICLCENVTPSILNEVSIDFKTPAFAAVFLAVVNGEVDARLVFICFALYHTRAYSAMRLRWNLERY